MFLLVIIIYMAKGKICRIEGCANILNVTAGQICQMHRSRFHRHGDYNISPNWSNLKKGKPSLTKLGYLRIFVSKEGKRVLDECIKLRIGETKRSHWDKFHLAFAISNKCTEFVTTDKEIFDAKRNIHSISTNFKITLLGH